MTRKPKNPKVPASAARGVLAQNVHNLMRRSFKESANMPLALAKAAKISLSSVQRMLSGETGATLDNIHAVAEVLDVAIYQLLIPYLNPNNPQVVKGASPAEQRMYRMLQKPPPVVKPRDKVAS